MAEMYYCGVCGYIYDPEKGEPRKEVSPGTPFENLPDLWRCPSCGAGKIRFRVKDRGIASIYLRSERIL